MKTPRLRIPAWKAVLRFFSFTATFSVVLQNTLWLAVALWAWRERPKRFFARFKDPFSNATLVFLATYFLGACLGVDPGHSFTTVHKVLVLLGMFPVAAMALDRLEKESLLKAYVLGSAVCGLWGILKHVAGKEDRISSFAGGYMVFGGLLMVASLSAVHFLIKNPKDRLVWAAFAVNLVALGLTQTRGAWLGFGAGFLLLLGWTRRRWALYGLAALGVAFLISPSGGRERVLDILRQNNRYQRSSDMERIHIWRAGTRILRDHPVFGIGQGNLEATYPAYRDPNALEPTVGHMHDNFMQVAVQNGLVGLMAFLFWIGAYLRMAWKNNRGDEAARALNRVLTCLFVASMVWGLTEYTFSHQFMSVQALLFGLQFANPYRTLRKS